ncbi:MAG TPA: VOC family protein [Gemmatimonadales bacterium]|nr:VOC family protein [Gemmatimonadales bacterium]
MISLLLLASIQAGATQSGATSRMDHVGIGVRDLEAATASFTRLGFVVRPGGQHPGGTENNLIFFPDGSYLELLGVHDTTKAADMAAMFRKREGAFFAGLRVNSAAGIATTLKGRNLEVVGPVGGTIRLPTDTGPPPDRWWIVSFKEQAWPWSSLFFLEYAPQFQKQAREDLRSQGAFEHPNSATRLYAAWFASFAPDSIVGPLEGIGMRLDPSVRSAKLGASARIARLEGGAMVVLLPKDATGLAGNFVQAGGNGVMGVTVAVKSVDSVVRAIGSNGADLKPYAGLFGRSVLVGPNDARGAWVEFAEIP